MAETTGTARQEAERLVATVLAMASQAGLGDGPKDRDSAGSSGLTDMISGLVGQFLGGAPDNPPPAAPRQHRDSADNTDGEQRPGAEDDGLRGADRQGADPRGSGGRQGAGQQGGGQRSTGRDSAAGRGHGRQSGVGQQLWDVIGGFGGWSTGSAECCVCPICRAIAGVRDPSPEQAERLATGAGEFASGVASLLRAFSVVAGTTGGSTRRKPPARPTSTPDQAWSAATRRTNPADNTPPHHEVREGDDPWTAATRAPQPQQAAAPAARAAAPAARAAAPAARAAAPAARAAAPADATTRTAAEQAATQTDAAGLTDTAGPVDTQAQTDAADGSAAGVRRQGDPWAAATRATRRPAPARKAGAAAAGGGATQAATTADAQPATDRGGRARREPVRDPAGASEKAGARTGKVGKAGAGTGKVGETGKERVTGATDVWAAATAANGDTAGDTGVADTPSVDHDVPGTAPAASAAEGRGAAPGGAARAGDAV